MADLNDQIHDNTKNPKRGTVDGNTAEQHTLKEQAEADRYVNSANAAKNRRRGLRFNEIVPRPPVMFGLFKRCRPKIAASEQVYGRRTKRPTTTCGLICPLPTDLPRNGEYGSLEGVDAGADRELEPEPPESSAGFPRRSFYRNAVEERRPSLMFPPCFGPRPRSG